MPTEVIKEEDRDHLKWEYVRDDKGIESAHDLKGSNEDKAQIGNLVPGAGYEVDGLKDEKRVYGQQGAVEGVIRVQDEVDRSSEVIIAPIDAAPQADSIYQVPDELNLPENPPIKCRFEVKTS